MRLLLFLALALVLAACGSDTPADAPVAPTPAPATAVTPDVSEPTEADDASDDQIDPSDAAAADDPVPAAGPPDEAPVPSAVTSEGFAVVNDTGMTLITLHIAGCGESEGEDWAEMETWATDYLGQEVLFAGDAWDVDVQPGCYVLRAEWEDGTVSSERVDATAGMTHFLMIG